MREGLGEKRIVYTFGRPRGRVVCRSLRALLDLRGDRQEPLYVGLLRPEYIPNIALYHSSYSGYKWRPLSEEDAEKQMKKLRERIHHLFAVHVERVVGAKEEVLRLESKL